MLHILMRFPGGKAKALTLSYDDGVQQDQKLMQIMKQSGLKGTFNLNSGRYAVEGTVFPAGKVYRRLTEKQAIELYTDSGQEVAVHTNTHPFLEKLPSYLVMEELIKDREILERQFHTIIRGMAYPFGTFNDEVVDCVKKSGIVYARTTISSHSFKMPVDWLRLEPTCHHDDEKLMELAQQFVEGGRASEREPWLFYLWGHSFEFEQKNNWEVIENFAAYIGGKEDIWYATNLEICDYVQAYKQLQFSVAGERVYNPTVTDIYFTKDGKDYCVKSGDTIELE